MPKPNKLKDLMIDGELTNRQLDEFCRSLFDGTFVLCHQDFPYSVYPPKYDSLPEHVRSFVRKALLESKIVNILEDN